MFHPQVFRLFIIYFSVELLLKLDSFSHLNRAQLKLIFLQLTPGSQALQS